MQTPQSIELDNGISIYPTLNLIKWQDMLKPFPNPASLLIFLKQQGIPFVHPDLLMGEHLNRYQYDELSLHNWSKLRNWRDLGDQSRSQITSPKAAAFLEKNPSEMTDAMRSGIIAHIIALGDDQSGLKPSEFKDFRTKESKIAKKEEFAKGKILLTKGENKKFEDFLEAFRLSGIHEVDAPPPSGIQQLLDTGFSKLGDLVNAGTIELTFTGKLDVPMCPDAEPILMPVKGRADLLIDLPDGRRWLFDLKTQKGHFNLANTQYKIGDMGYDAQMALYAHMCGATAVYIITADISPPYQTIVTHLPEPKLAEGLQIARRALRNYKHYHDQQHFPGLASGEYGNAPRSFKSTHTQANPESIVVELDETEFAELAENSLCVN